MSEAFHEAYRDLWVDIARNIADEKRPTPKAETAKAAIVDKLVAEVVKARLALSGVTDPAQIAAVAKRVTVSESGDLVGLDADGRPGVGSGPNCTLSLDDVASDIGATAQPETSSHGKNPFRPGADFNLTAQMLMLKNDPERAEHFQYLASIGK